MATIKLADGRSELYQWDTGRKVVIDDESQAGALSEPVLRAHD